MTASYLISEIFSRSQAGVPSHIRRITERQFNTLCGLIYKEPAVTRHREPDGSLIWKPEGSEQYLLREDLATAKHTLTRHPKIECSDVYINLPFNGFE